MRLPWRRAAVAVTLGLSGLVLSGCTGMGVSRDLPSWSPGVGLPAGVVQGVLRWDGTCVRLEADDGVTWVVAWPTGTRLREDQVPPLLVDARDRGIAYLGDRITLAGVPDVPAGAEPAVVPPDCRDAPLWYGVPLRP